MPQQFVSLLLSILFLLKCAADYTGEQFTVALELDYFGTIVITTVPADAFPLATKTFLGNVRRRMYEGCVFYRLETFVLQEVNAHFGMKRIDHHTFYTIMVEIVQSHLFHHQNGIMIFLILSVQLH